MSTQLESRHFYQAGDTVQHVDGKVGTVAEAFALWAKVRWEDGKEEEVDQLDHRIAVIERARKE
ncbi:MAG TPA: hypothetical protein VFQ39_09405 [Longimicrobium sp.]|nr:hypothetical protein [Longimicrobium sp.]